MLKYITSIIVAAGLCSCATVGHQLPIGSPAQVQADVTALAGVAKPYVPAADQALIHQYATDLSQVADANTTALYALIPSTGNTQADALIQASAVLIDSAIRKFGQHNQTSLLYIHAVANGLLADF